MSRKYLELVYALFSLAALAGTSPQRFFLRQITSACAQVMLLPEATPEAGVIMVATGTGVAPFRSFWKRLFIEKTPAAENFKVNRLIYPCHFSLY